LRIAQAGLEIVTRERRVLDASLDGAAVGRLLRRRAQRRDLGADADERVLHANEDGAAVDDGARHARHHYAAAVHQKLSHRVSITRERSPAVRRDSANRNDAITGTAHSACQTMTLAGTRT